MVRTLDPHWYRRWYTPKTGRYWKRQLAKARRKYAKACCLGMRHREPVGYESTVNWRDM